MRLRKLKNAKDILNNNQNYFINNDVILRKKIFNNDNATELEIGMGKGNFILEKATNNKDINFIGIELNETICAKAIKKINERNIKINNLKIININADKMNEIFLPQTIDKIYLNFSDPWPKSRHEKKRLTSPKFINIYKNILKQNGTIEFKSDNHKFYEYTLNILKQYKDIKILYETNDLYNHLDEFNNSENIQTEYEKKFVSNGNQIYKIVFKFTTN